MSGKRARSLRVAPEAPTAFVLGEELDDLLPLLDRLTLEPRSDGYHECQSWLDDDEVLPVARALLRAEAEVLTAETIARELTRHGSISALVHLVTAIAAADLAQGP